MTNTVVSSDDYLEKLKKTIPGDLTAIYLSFRMIVGNTYGFDANVAADTLNVSLVIDYIQHLLIFMIPLSIIGIAYLYFVSRIESAIQIAVILISYLLWMISLDIGFYSIALKVGQISFGIRGIDLLLKDKVLFIGITLLWTFSIPVIYSAANRFGWMK